MEKERNMPAKEAPNKERLTEEERMILEDEEYRLQYTKAWGFAPGDPRLKTSEMIATEEED